MVVLVAVLGLVIVIRRNKARFVGHNGDSLFNYQKLLDRVCLRKDSTHDKVKRDNDVEAPERELSMLNTGITKHSNEASI